MTTPRKSAPKPRRSPMEHPRHQYPEETAALQSLAKAAGLNEQIKWGKPCFTLGGRNIALIQRFNDYVALLFFKGALLADPDALLSRIGQHTETPRQLRFTSLPEITRLTPAIRGFLAEAIALEQPGAKAPPRTPASLELPEELSARFRADPALERAFAALTPGRRRGYILQIAAAKQPATRTARVDKYIPHILAGKGLND